MPQLRDGIKGDFLADLEAGAALRVNGTRVVTIKQRACKLCDKTDCPDCIEIQRLGNRV